MLTICFKVKANQQICARKSIWFDQVVCTRLEISQDYIQTESYRREAREKNAKKTAGCYQSSVRPLSRNPRHAEFLKGLLIKD